MIQLDERLGAIASLALEIFKDRQSPVGADIGCDHGYLTAYLLEHCEKLTMIAGDVSAPSLEKAKRLLAARGLAHRAQTVVSDGLGCVDRPVDVIVMAGMGASTIARIVREGKARIGQASLIVQANVDLAALRSDLAREGFVVCREVFSFAAGRRYVTMLARPGEKAVLSPREALLGSGIGGIKDEGQYAYFAWQRDVRVREMEQVARLASEKARVRMEKNSEELTCISEAMNMNACCVSDIERLVGEIAPYGLAEEWDNVGLLVGRKDNAVTRVLTALDLTEGVIDEAAALGAQLIVTHHPMMLSARRRITEEDREGRMIIRLLENRLAHIAAHTNLDAAPGGVNDRLMTLVGAENVRGEGCMRVGDLPEGMTLGALAERARQRLGGPVRIYGGADRPVRVLGCCSGAGGSFFDEARALGADCFITGEVKHHVALDAVDAGMGMLEAGHFETENPVCEVLADALQKACDELKYNVTVFCSKGNPFGR